MDILIGYDACSPFYHTEVYGCSYSPNGLYIISVSSDETMKVWNSETGKCILSLKLESSGCCCGVSMDGMKIVAGIGKKCLLLLSVPSSMNMSIESPSLVAPSPLPTASQQV